MKFQSLKTLLKNRFWLPKNIKEKSSELYSAMNLSVICFMLECNCKTNSHSLATKRTTTGGKIFNTLPVIFHSLAWMCLCAHYFFGENILKGHVSICYRMRQVFCVEKFSQLFFCMFLFFIFACVGGCKDFPS